MKTLIEFFDPPIMRLCLIIFVAMVGLAGYNWISWSSLSASEWATWVGSIGTLGTLAGTIWLATDAERRRHREQTARALVVSASIGLKVSEVRDAIASVIEYLADELKLGYQIDIPMVSARLSECANWTDDEILPLIVLDGKVAAKLATTRTALDYTQTQLSGLNALANGFHAGNSPVVVLKIVNRLRDIDIILTSVSDEIDRFHRSPV